MKSKLSREAPLLSERSRYNYIGYAKQSNSNEISIDDQVKALKKDSCIVALQEKFSTTNNERPQSETALNTLEECDEIIVFTKLNREFRSLRQCIQALHHIQKKEFMFVLRTG